MKRTMKRLFTLDPTEISIISIKLLTWAFVGFAFAYAWSH